MASHQEQGDEQAACEHQATQLGGLGIRGQCVDHEAEQAHEQRNDYQHAGSVTIPWPFGYSVTCSTLKL